MWYNRSKAWNEKKNVAHIQPKSTLEIMTPVFIACFHIIHAVWNILFQKNVLI